MKVHDFEDLKVESSKKLTKLLTKRHSRHNKVCKEFVSCYLVVYLVLVVYLEKESQLP